MTTTGHHIKAAMSRAQEHQILCERKLRVRIMTQFSGTATNRTGVIFTEEWQSPGLLIRAHISSRGDDWDKQGSPGDGGHCERLVKWEDLDARAGELVGLVDECVAGCCRLLGIDPPQIVADGALPA